MPLAWACALCVHASQAAAPVLETTFGPPPMPSHWGQRVQKFAAGEPMVAGDYRIRAEVVPRLAGEAALESGMVLSPGAVSRQADGSATVELAAPAGTHLSDFDTLVVEHGYRPGCPVGLDLALQSDTGAASRPRLALQDMVQGGDEVVMSERPPQMEWTKKDLGYLLRRQLGLPGDPRWRYAQDGDFTVIQRRMDVPLERVRTIELEFPSKTVLSGVNLSIGTGPASRARHLLSGGEFTSRTQDDGVRTRVFLYLGNALLHSPSGKDPYLKEILISYQGTEADVAQRKPLLSMRMVGTALASSSGDDPSRAVRSVQPDSAGKPRWQSRFDLRRWHALAPHDVAALEVTADGGCSIGALQARLLPANHARLPLFQAQAAQQLKALGGPFLPSDRGAMEWLQWAAQLPLAQARTEPRRLDTPGFQAELPGWNARWTLDGEAARIAMTETGLLVSGARKAQLEWAVDVAVQPGLRLHAGMPSGTRQFAALEVELQLDTGAVWRLQVAPNRALPLPDDLPPHSRVRKVRVHFDTQSAPEDWTLASLGIFRSYAVPLSQTDDQPRPGWKLVPQALAMDGNAAANADYRWDMPVGMRSGDLLQAHITHGFDASRAEACWLTVEATGDRGAHVRHRMCPSGPSWNTGLAELWSRGGFAADETVVSMRWTARLSAPPGRPGDLAVALGVGASPSVRKVLSMGPVLRLGEDSSPPLRPQGPPAALPALSLPVWLDYGTWTAAAGQAVPAVHWDGADIFELRRITWVAAPALWPALLERQQHLRRQAVVATPSPERGLRLQSAWLLLFAALVFWFAGRASAPGTLATRATAFLVHRATRALQSAWTRLHRVLPARSQRLPVIASTALASLLAWLGGRGGPDAAWLTLTAAFLAVLACLRLWQGGSTAIPAPQQSPQRAVAAVLWIVSMAWVGGQGGLPQRPLTYAGLAVAVLLFDRTMPLRLVRRLLPALGNTAGILAVACAALYAMGTAATGGKLGENAWLTMGALVAVGAWWRMLQGLRPALQDRHPGWAGYLFATPGGPLFAGAVVALALSALWLYLGGPRVAAHMTTLFFYQWCAGALVTAVSPWARPDRTA
ncbi:hypothetical protein M5C99_19195 [Acidovorax sp. NCPPB 2350]|nr:hypothetical protein M5C99_19195 [Acidovorax sp. NCPPB 2350]